VRLDTRSGVWYPVRMTVLDDLLAAYTKTLTAPTDPRPAAYSAGLTAGYNQGVIDGKASVTPTPPVVTTPPVTTTTAIPTGNVVSNGRTWMPKYSNDFTDTAALSKMSTYSGFKDTSGYGLYSPSKVLTVHDSYLDYYLHTENGQPLVAAVMPDNYAPHASARVSIRYKSDAIPGYKFVGMLWPSSNQWVDGEIDWPEGDLNGKVRPAMEIVDGTTGKFLPKTEMFSATDQSDWHVATTEWDSVKGTVSFYWDDKLITTVSQTVPTKPMRVTLQAETWIGQGKPSATSAGHLLIDWIVVYE